MRVRAGELGSVSRLSSMRRPPPPLTVDWDVPDVLALWVGACANSASLDRSLDSQFENDDDAQSPFAAIFGIYAYEPTLVVRVFRPTVAPVQELLSEAPYFASWSSSALAACASLGVASANVAIVFLNFSYSGSVARAAIGDASLVFAGNHGYSFTAPDLPSWLFRPAGGESGG